MTNPANTPATTTAAAAAAANTDSAVAKLVEASATGRGRSKTGHPTADRQISDAQAAKKAAPAKTPAVKTPAVAKAAPAKTAPAKTAKAAPAKTAPAKTAPAKPVRAAKVWAPVTLPAGYTVRWDNGAYDLAKKGDGAADGAATWVVVCKTHGTMTTADSTKAADALGRRAGRATWCKGCKN